MKRWTALAIGVALGACNAPAPPAGNTTAAAPATGRNYVTAVAALRPTQLNAVLYHAIHQADLPCQMVTGATRVAAAAPSHGRWRAHCADDVDHLVDIAPDGNALVISRNDQ